MIIDANNGSNHSPGIKNNISIINTTTNTYDNHSNDHSVNIIVVVVVVVVAVAVVVIIMIIIMIGTSLSCVIFRGKLSYIIKVA